MAHVTTKDGYRKLTDRLNRFPQGAPPSETLEKILRMLFREPEAALVALLPIKPFTATDASRIWKKSLTETRNILDSLASRALLTDVEHNGETFYTLPPPMAGFFEFSLMRVRDDIDQKMLSELFYQYLNVEEDFIKALFTEGETQLGRMFVHEPALSAENVLHVMDYERASETIRTAEYRAVGTCYCRHKMHHLNRACSAPMEMCMTFGSGAKSLVKHGFARSIDAVEGLDLLHLAYENNLIQFGENVRQNVEFICHCCGCCCEALLAAKRFGFLHPVHTTNFIPTLDENLCKDCLKCVTSCPVEAMTAVSANDPHHPKRKKPKLDEDLCLGCGICVRTCSTKALSLISRSHRVITPLNSTHRIVLMAIERGKLQNLIFDNRILYSHRALAAVLGTILKLPPLKQTLANKQLRSRYVETLLTKLHY